PAGETDIWNRPGCRRVRSIQSQGPRQRAPRRGARRGPWLISTLLFYSLVLPSYSAGLLFNIPPNPCIQQVGSLTGDSCINVVFVYVKLCIGISESAYKCFGFEVASRVRVWYQVRIAASAEVGLGFRTVEEGGDPILNVDLFQFRTCFQRVSSYVGSDGCLRNR